VRSGQGWRYNNNIKGRDGQTASFQIRAPLARLLPLTAATNNNCRSTLLFCIWHKSNTARCDIWNMLLNPILELSSCNILWFVYDLISNEYLAYQRVIGLRLLSIRSTYKLAECKSCNIIVTPRDGMKYKNANYF